MKKSIWFIVFFTLSIKSFLAFGEVIPRNVNDSLPITHLELKALESKKESTIVRKLDFTKLPPVKKEIEVYNTTAYDLENLIQWVGAYLGLSGIKINVYSLPKKFTHDGVLIKKEDNYTIHLKKNLPQYKLILIHEMIHVKQYEFEELQVLSETMVHFNGKNVDLDKMEYELRPYEKEAHAKDQYLLRLFNQYMKRKSKREKFENPINPEENEKCPPPAIIAKGCRKAPVI